jgi:hypothetical protein
LCKEGYRDIKLEIARPWNFVLDENGRQIDVHVIVLDHQGNGILLPGWPPFGINGFPIDETREPERSPVLV